MCLIVFAWQSHPKYKLVFAANRDEYYSRPSMAADWWQDNPPILGGKDLKAGGTWLGITRSGRIAAVTNFRGKDTRKWNPPSRGKLVSDYLLSNTGAESYLEELRKNSGAYNGFNLLVGDPEHLYYYSNKLDEITLLAPGIFGLSNHFLNTPWPKVSRGKQTLEQSMAGREELDLEDILNRLADREIAPDGELPDTGIGIAHERALSPLFIDIDGYGTRSSTVITIGRDNQVTFLERSFHPPVENTYTFSIAP